MWQSGIETFIMTPRGNAAPAGANQSAPQSPGAGIHPHSGFPQIDADFMPWYLEKFPPSRWQFRVEEKKREPNERLSEKYYTGAILIFS